MNGYSPLYKWCFHSGKEERSTAHAIWLFPLHGRVSLRESPEHKSCDEHCNQYQESNQPPKNSEERIVEEKCSGFQSFYDPCRLAKWDGSLRVIDHQHIAIACIIITSPIAGIQNGRSKCSVRFLFDQTGFLQVRTDRISFQVNGGSNVMGGKMVGATQLNPAIIGRRSNPDRLSIDECAGFPGPNMSPVLDIIGRLFKRQILDSPKDVEVTDWRVWVASVSKTISSHFRRCLWGNWIRNQPPRLVKALHNLIPSPDKEHVYWVSLGPGLGVGYFWIGRKVIGIGVKTDKSNECYEKHQQDTKHAHKSDDHFSHTQASSNVCQTVRLPRRIPVCGLNGRHPAFGDMPQIIGHLFQAPVGLARPVRKSWKSMLLMNRASARRALALSCCHHWWMPFSVHR